MPDFDAGARLDDDVGAERFYFLTVSGVRRPGSRRDRPHALPQCAFTELFALVQGRLFSSAGLDNGIAVAARRLLEEVQVLSGLDRGVLVTFSPDTESVDHTIGLVRLRFPGTTVWDLPFAVHEFGHHAVHELTHIDAAHSDERPLRSLVTGPFGTKAGIDESHVHELVADVFATVALGATYPIACIQRRINAKQRATDGTTHPSWERRVATMVAALNHMTKLSDDKRYAATATQLVLPAWQALTGQAAPPDAPELKALAHKAVDVLARHAPKLPYDDKESAVLVKYELTTAAEPGPPRPVEVPRERRPCRDRRRRLALAAAEPGRDACPAIARRQACHRAVHRRTDRWGN